MSTSLPELT